MDNLKAIEYIKEKVDIKPEIGIILGSGLGNFADNIGNKVEISYSKIPGFTQSSVKGHEGKLIFGTVRGKNIVAMKGRLHYYEGLGVDKVVFPTKVLCDLKIKNLIVTNACGACNRDFNPGDIMIINDHINFAGVNPLIGKNDDNVGPRFLDMSEVYSKDLINIAKNVFDRLNMKYREGVYMYFTGPTYETKSEVKMARILGADTVGMSTVPEVIVARHRGVKILGLSCVTNMGTGILDEPLDHKEVIEVTNKIESNFNRLVEEIIGDM